MVKKSAMNHFPELSHWDVQLINHVIKNKWSMTAAPRLVNTLLSCKYIVENKLPGDFIECGVWRGGHAIIAKSVFQRLGSEKKVYLFDTFDGMTQPSEHDVGIFESVAASELFAKYKTGKGGSDWCLATIDEVRENFLKSGCNLENVHMVKGDVMKTLPEFSGDISDVGVLRLDTDFYSSTKIELEILYPKLIDRGVLIIDDYGYWAGSKKAVDEYFSRLVGKPLFFPIDHSARSAIKIL